MIITCISLFLTSTLLKMEWIDPVQSESENASLTPKYYTIYTRATPNLRLSIFESVKKNTYGKFCAAFDRQKSPEYVILTSKRLTIIIDYSHRIRLKV